jgi:hypothetical protein
MADNDGVPPFTENKVLWALKPFDYDEASFEKQILNILKGADEVDDGYSEFTFE